MSNEIMNIQSALSGRLKRFNESLPQGYVPVIRIAGQKMILHKVETFLQEYLVFTGELLQENHQTLPAIEIIVSGLPLPFFLTAERRPDD